MRMAKTVCITEVDEAAANINSDINSASEELSEKESASREPESERIVDMAACRRRITYVLYQGIGSYLIVRAQTRSYSKVPPLRRSPIATCPRGVPDECTVSCVDQCPAKLNPDGGGGWQQLSRDGAQFLTSLAVKV